MAICYTEVDSPVGPLLLAGDDEALHVISFERSRWAARRSSDWIQDARPFREVMGQLRAYFAGDRREFDVRIKPHGTDFERTVWKALMEIPYGRTISYGELARRIGHPTAARAVGLANGRNPLPIVVPCHRVIGADGSLTGYGGGLETKRWLLTLEGALPAPTLFDSGKA
jgi:methylated-DNA-[protein]-cysteine S-methyltransferase